MPIYTFRCIVCEKEFESLVKMGTKSMACEHCGKYAHKIQSLSNFILKGGGWASEGYSKQGNKKK